MSFFKDLLFEPNLTAPLYQQIYTQLRSAILSGRLRGGTKLPSSRMLAKDLQISRNTVLNAYEQLLTEGYLESIPGGGTFIASILPEQLLGEPLTPETPPTEQKHSRVHQLSEQGQAVVRTPAMGTLPYQKRTISPIALHGALPALDSFPMHIWSRLLIKYAQQLSPTHLTYQRIGGYEPLKEAIADYVNLSRGVRCTPEQVIITNGSQGALDLAARMLLNPRDTAWIEDPGYLGGRSALLNTGAHVVPVPLDQEGLVVNEGINKAPEAHLVYITPSHQFPLGITMSLRRRLELLAWAQDNNAYILEDDYNSEFRYGGRPLAALQGLDENESVLYIGTMSKVLFPSLRLGYLIVPPSLVKPFLAVKAYVDNNQSIMDQVVLTEFIREGHFARHLRRMRTLYASRRVALMQALQAQNLPLEISAPEAGMHLIAWLPSYLEDQAVVKQAAEQGLRLTPVSLFTLKPLERGGLILGYTGARESELQAGVERLAAILRPLFDS
jgi:GntR family transcriptional regulator / MocR family aminotransferase